MSENRYAALLRGINVGGNNLIKMVELKVAFEELGFTDVVTYIQSGNVVFSAKAASKPKLVKKIEAALGATFGYAARVAVVSAHELELVVSQAPPRFGAQPEKFRYDVLFVLDPLTPAELVEQIPTKPGVDEVFAGEHALYFRRLIAKATQSRLPRLIALPIYRNITIRNWNTTRKLLALATEK